MSYWLIPDDPSYPMSRNQCMVGIAVLCDQYGRTDGIPWDLVFHPVSYGHPDVALCYPDATLPSGFRGGPLHAKDLHFRGIVHIGTVHMTGPDLFDFMLRSAANFCRNSPSLPAEVWKIDSSWMGAWAMRILDAFEVAGVFRNPISKSDEFFTAVQNAISNLPSKPFKRQSGDGLPVIDIAAAHQQCLRRDPLVPSRPGHT